MPKKISTESLLKDTSDVLARSKQPIYLQLVAEFKRNIAQRVWPAGTQIPSLEALMEKYHVARMTIRNAIAILEDEGYVRRGRGIGTFVLEHVSHIEELQIPTNWEEAVKLSDFLGMQSIFEEEQKITSPPDIGFDYDGGFSREYVHFHRVHLKGETPFCYSEVYLCADLFNRHADLFRRYAAASVIDRIDGMKLSAARQKITIAGAGFLSAKALNLNVGDSVAEVRRYACSQDTLIYFARLEFPTQFVKIEFDLLKG